MMNETTYTAPLPEGTEALFDRLGAVRQNLQTLRHDACLSDPIRAAAGWLDLQLDLPAFGATLAVGDWDGLSAIYAQLLNALKIAEGLVRRLRRCDLVPTVRDAACKLWFLMWRRLVDVDGLSPELAHIRLSLLDQRFRQTRSTTHAA